jgi:VWFA-related protein
MPPRASAAILLALCASGLAAPSILAQAVREKVSVEVLTLKVAARDRSGRSVDDLTPADLTLTVDGKPVAIDTLSQAAAVAPRDEPADSETRPPSSASVASVSERRLRTLILFDEAGTNGYDKRVVYDELQRLLGGDGGGRRDVMVGRFTGSRLEVTCPWTAESDRAVAALRAMRESPVSNTMPSASDLAASRPPVTWIQVYREHFHQTLLEALAAFPDEPADRQLLIVSGGTSILRPFDLGAVLSCQVTPGERARLRLIDSDVGRAHAREIERATFALWSRAVNPSGDALTMTDVVAKAIERDVAIIPVAAEAIDRGLDLGLDQRMDMRHLEVVPVASAGDGRMTARTSAAQSMTEIAESTGSEPILVPGKTAARLSEIGSRPAYVLTFRDRAGDHRYHRIELACRRKGVSLDYRRGYRISTEDERMLDNVVARLAGPAARADGNPLGAQVTASAGSEEHMTLLAISIAPPRDSAPAAERIVELVGVGEDSAGQRTEPVSWSGTARAVEDAPGVYAARTKLGVHPGDFRWSLAVRDAETGLTSYVLIPASR